MQITEVRVKKVHYEKEPKLKALATIVFDGEFVVNDLRVIEGLKGVFVSMPRRKTAEGSYKDVAHPITAGARETIQNAVLAAYHEAEVKEAVSI